MTKPMIAPSRTRPLPLSKQPAEARQQVAQLLAEAGWGGEADMVVLAVHEAMVNAQRHAGGVTAASVSLDGQAVVVEVRDKGQGFSVPESPSMPDPAGERGRGLFLIRRLAERADVVHTGGETCLNLRFEK